MSTITERQLIDSLPIIKESIYAANKLSDKFGICRSYFKGLRIILGYTSPRKKTTDKEKMNELVQSLKNGEHPIDCSKRTGIKLGYIYSIARKNKIPFSKRDFWTDRKIMRLVSMRNSGVSFKKIAEQLGCTEHAASGMMYSLIDGKTEKWAKVYAKTPGFIRKKA